MPVRGITSQTDYQNILSSAGTTKLVCPMLFFFFILVDDKTRPSNTVEWISRNAWGHKTDRSLSICYHLLLLGRRWLYGCKRLCFWQTRHFLWRWSGTTTRVMTEFFFLYIFAYLQTWCGPCQMIKPIFEKLSNQYLHVVFVKVQPGAPFLESEFLTWTDVFFFSRQAGNILTILFPNSMQRSMLTSFRRSQALLESLPCKHSG